SVSVQETFNEQTEQQSVVTENQEKQELVSEETSSVGQAPAETTVEESKSPTLVKQKDHVGRTRKGESAKSGKKTPEIRVTFIVDPDLIRKVKFISLVDGMLLKDILSQALNNYVDAWEEKNKKIRLPKFR
ncbi:hypothetical protein EVA_20099, partial [gut metagenome]